MTLHVESDVNLKKQNGLSPFECSFCSLIYFKDVIEKLLADTSLHERLGEILAENINKTRCGADTSGQGEPPSAEPKEQETVAQPQPTKEQDQSRSLDDILNNQVKDEPMLQLNDWFLKDYFSINESCWFYGFNYSSSIILFYIFLLFSDVIDMKFNRFD